MGLIYMRISPSGGMYIGQTILTEEHRWRQHCNSANNSKSVDYDCILSRAIRKYGSNSFKVQILEDNIPNDILNEREKYWIEKYKTYNKDNPKNYNMTRGGEGRAKFLDEELLLLWEQGLTLGQIGNIVNGTPYYLGIRLKNLGIDTKLFRIRANNDSSLNNIKNNPKNEIIYQLWKQGLSITDIHKKIKCDIHTATNMLQKLYNVPYEEIQLRKNLMISNSKKKIIYQYDLEDNFLKEWISATDAGKELKLDISSIRACVRGTRKTCGGYKWKDKKV